MTFETPTSELSDDHLSVKLRAAQEDVEAGRVARCASAEDVRRYFQEVRAQRT